MLLSLNHRQHIFETEQLPMLLSLNHRQHIFETEQLPMLLSLIHRQHIFETEQLPMLLSLNHRQHIFETEQLPMLLSLIHRQHIFETEQLPMLLSLNHRQHIFETEQLPMLLSLNHRQHIFETEQLPMLLSLIQKQHIFETEIVPKLLKALSDLNHRQLSTERDQDNLLKSVPIALRTITRNSHDVSAHLESLSSSMDQRVSETRGELESLSTTLYGKANDLQDKLEDLTSSVSYLLGRVEFVRRETMFEMRYGAKAPQDQLNQVKTDISIVHPEKIAAARAGELRLNLGCGNISLEGYLNVDRRSLPGVDIVADVDELPFGAGEVDEIFSAHLLEHFPLEQLRRQLLPYYYSLLKEGGIFRAVVPDAEAMIQNYVKGEYPYDDMREVMYGAQDYDGDFHFNMFTPESMKKLLQEAGFTAVHVNATGRPNGKCFELEVCAKK